MAIFTVNIGAYSNQAPTQIGDLTLSLDYNETHTFTQANFTTETVPQYSDPEGDAVSTVKILTLPVTGVLYLNAIAVIANQEITLANINANLFTYVADAGTITAYSDSFTFDIADAGSLTYSGLTGTVNINVAAQNNQPPSEVGDGSATIDYAETLVFTSAMFTSGTTPAYADPEADPAENLKILSLPALGVIYYNGVPVQVNDVIPLSDVDLGLLTYVPDLADTDGDSQGFTFAVSDAGSGIYTT